MVSSVIVSVRKPNRNPQPLFPSLTLPFFFFALCHLLHLSTVPLSPLRIGIQREGGFLDCVLCGFSLPSFRPFPSLSYFCLHCFQLFCLVCRVFAQAVLTCVLECVMFFPLLPCTSAINTNAQNFVSFSSFLFIYCPQLGYITLSFPFFFCISFPFFHFSLHYRSSKSIVSFVLVYTSIDPHRILIDIPSTLHLDRLQHQEAQTRSKEYLSVLNTVKLPQQTIRKLYSMTSVTTSNNHSNGDLQVPDHDSVKRGGSGSSASSGHSVKAPSVRDVLAEKAIDAKTLGWVSFRVLFKLCLTIVARLVPRVFSSNINHIVQFHFCAFHTSLPAFLDGQCDGRAAPGH